MNASQMTRNCFNFNVDIAMKKETKAGWITLAIIVGAAALVCGLIFLIEKAPYVFVGLMLLIAVIFISLIIYDVVLRNLDDAPKKKE